MAHENSKIQVDRDELLTKHAEWAKGEANDASKSGTRRDAIGAFAEKTGLENKALSQFRAGMKIKQDGKRRDWVRSMRILIDIADDEIFKNEPDLGLEDENDKGAETAAEEANKLAEDHGAGGDEPPREASMSATDPEEAPETDVPEEQAEFNDEVDRVVTPFEANG